MQSPEDIIAIMRRNLVEPAVFVLSTDKDGRANGMSAGWNMKVSYDPPMLAVALLETGNTQRLIQESGQFVVAVPSPELREQLEYFGAVSGADVDKFEKSGIATRPGTIGRTPLLAAARINFECVLDNQIKPADHYVFFGRIIAAHYDKTKDQIAFTGRGDDGLRTFQTIEDPLKNQPER